MRFAHFALLLAFLLSCTAPNLPPPPPSPGSSSFIGQAIGGVPISPDKLPSWAAQIQHTDITPHVLKEGETVKITVEQPTGLETTFYAFGKIYYFDTRSNVWKDVSAKVSESGDIVSGWVKDKAVFEVEVSRSKFDYGRNFLITYWCINTEEFNDDGERIWICNNNKWGLGAFEMRRRGYPEYLIEEDIGSNRFNISTRAVVENGVQYEAVYHGTSSIDYVRVLELDSPAKYKEVLAQNYALLSTLWTEKGNACGFYQSDQKTMSWISDEYRIAVQSSDIQKIIEYAEKYPADCNLINELERISEGLEGYCGNGIVEKPEHCDFNSDDACPGACRPDCTCSFVGQKNNGTCGDLLLQKPNINGFNEQCEPVEKRDPVTGQVISGSSCFVRDSGKITGIGHCDHACRCVPGVVSLPDCGDGSCSEGEDFESCPADCINDTFIPEINISKPLPNQTLTSTSVEFVVHASDNFAVANCELDINVDLKRKDANKWVGTGLLTNGTYNVKVTCIDIAGKSNVSFRNFTVNVSADNTAPSIDIISPSDQVSSSVTYKIKATDSSGIKTCAAFTDGAEQALMVQNNNEWSLQRTLSVGSHKVKFECSDIYGNKASKEKSFTVNS